MADRFDNVSMYALVMEDQPTGGDSRLVFESFPAEGLEESYAVAAYREMGGNRSPQPQFATYQGGNWGTFTVSLKFRAGEQNASSPGDVDAVIIDQLLVEMENKVNWCVALLFPLVRKNKEVQRRVKSLVRKGVPASKIATQAAANLPRADPPTVLVVMGTWRIIRAYATNVTYKWEGPYHPQTGRPYGADVRIQFQPIMSKIPNYQEIRNRGTFNAQAADFQRLPAADQQRITLANQQAATAAFRSQVQQSQAAAARAAGGG